VWLTLNEPSIEETQITNTLVKTKEAVRKMPTLHTGNFYNSENSVAVKSTCTETSGYQILLV
jgi:hypothetical protein